MPKVIGPEDWAQFCRVCEARGAADYVANHRVLEVSDELLEHLDPDDVGAELEQLQPAAVLAEHPAATVIVTTTGLRLKEG